MKLGTCSGNSTITGDETKSASLTFLVDITYNCDILADMGLK